VQHAVARSACQDCGMQAEIFECTLGTCHKSYCDGCTSFRHCNKIIVVKNEFAAIAIPMYWREVTI